MGMRDALEREFAESWKPKEGDEIQGIVVAVDSNEDKWGNTYPIYTVRVVTGENDAEVLTDDELAIHCAATAMRNWATEQTPPITEGDWLGVVYEGRKEGKSGNSFYSYKKAVIRADKVPARLKVTGPAPVPNDDEEPF